MYNYQPDVSQQAISNVEVSEFSLDSLELTVDNVLIEICKNDIKHPIIVLKQVLLETGHLKCTNCSLDYNNLFGIGWNGKTYFRVNLLPIGDFSNICHEQIFQGHSIFLGDAG